jgi:hypothetical protein
MVERWTPPPGVADGSSAGRNYGLAVEELASQGIDSAEIIETVHARRAPAIPVSASLRL